MTEAPLISVENLTRHYTVGEEEVRALDGVSFDVMRGEWVAVVGQSGSGKSTLMNLIGALDTPTSGSYRINGHDVEHLTDDELADLRNNEIGFVFQTFQLLSRSTALANVELPLVYRGISRKERRERAVKALEAVGLQNRMHHRPNELSGGQRQRVAIARALVGNPSLLLADEPTGNLDSATGEEIIKLFGELHRRGHTILLVTHEPKLAARCPRAIRLSDGKVVADGPGADVASLGVPPASQPPAARPAGAAA
ncbi:MAG TPA: ABC transporter ATP-binding protein [Anaeromyxobacteraceae bacterium]|nr:ABC transporter ATP-binding protein [Anaeromyxobacteraceae bacterium]